MSRQVSKVVNLRGRPQETRRQVLERLFREHGSALRAFLTVRMGGSADLEDVVQEVFVRLSRMDNLQERLPAGNDSNRSFIFAVANNLVLDLERSRQVRRRYVEAEQVHAGEDDAVYDATPESVALAGQELEQIKELIMNLKPAWRTAFVLSRFRHKSYREVAAEMGVSVKQVEWFMKCALARLQKAAADILKEDNG